MQCIPRCSPLTLCSYFKRDPKPLCDFYRNHAIGMLQVEPTVHRATSMPILRDATV